MTILMMTLTTNAQSIAVKAALQKYKNDTCIRLKTAAKSILHTQHGARMNEMVDLIKEAYDSAGASSLTTLNTALGNGNTSNRFITLKSKVVSRDSVTIGLRADSTGYLLVTRNAGSGIAFYACDDSMVSRVPTTVQYLVGYGPSPSLSLDACAGVGATYTVTPGSTYGSGRFSVTTGTSACATANVYYYLEFPSPNLRAAARYISISPANYAAAIDWTAGGVVFYQGGTSSSASLARAAAPAPPAGTILKYYYFLNQ